MKKKYKGIFFDWDGTAVLSRKTPVEEIVKAMGPLLDQKVNLVIVSGTTMENIAGGKLDSYFTKEQLEHLYLGLGRGAFNYRYENGQEIVFSDMLPDRKLLSDIHRICFDIHMELLEKYGMNTDIVFSRPNYCKIDLMVENQRGDNLFMQGNELDLLKDCLKKHGAEGGLQGLLDISEAAGARYGITVKPNTWRLEFPAKAIMWTGFWSIWRRKRESARRSAASGEMSMWELRKAFTEATAL